MRINFITVSGGIQGNHFITRGLTANYQDYLTRFRRLLPKARIDLHHSNISVERKDIVKVSPSIEEERKIIPQTQSSIEIEVKGKTTPKTKTD